MTITSAVRFRAVVESGQVIFLISAQVSWMSLRNDPTRLVKTLRRAFAADSLGGADLAGRVDAPSCTTRGWGAGLAAAAARRCCLVAVRRCALIRSRSFVPIRHLLPDAAQKTGNYW
jgi:hypothetical protein